ncbi:MAG: hypothetical protein LBK82_00025 [Planctomycetaceae bacterium]|nr:hypothetical protein [Planctomycetaceae bacterium]
MGDPPAGRLRRLSLKLTLKRKVIQIAAVNLIHSRLTPTRPFSKMSPT